MPQAQSADGKLHDFPEGTDPTVIDRVMKQYAQSQKDPTEDALGSGVGMTGEPTLPPSEKGGPAAAVANFALGAPRAGAADVYGLTHGQRETPGDLLPTRSGFSKAREQSLEATKIPEGPSGEAVSTILNFPGEMIVRAAHALSNAVLGPETTEAIAPVATVGMDVAALAGLRAREAPPKLTMTSAATAPLRKALGWWLDLDPELLDRVAGVAAEGPGLGHHVAPGAWSTMPFAQRKVDLAKFYGYDPMKPAAREILESGSQKVLEKYGLTPTEAATEKTQLKSTIPPSPIEAGKAITQTARTEYREKIAGFMNQVQGLRERATEAGKLAVAKLRDHGQLFRQDLLKQRAAMDVMVDAGWDELKRIRDVADPRGLATFMADKTNALRNHVADSAESIYAAADALFGVHKIDVSQGRAAVRDFADELPAEFKDNFPKLGKLLDQFKTGEMTGGELHFLRSIMRDMGYASNEKLPPSFRRGPYKFFAGVIDSVLHDEKNHPQVQAGAKVLDEADTFYRTEMARFHDHVIQTFVDNVRAGMPPDPVAVSRLIIQGSKENKARLNEVLSMAGEEGRQKIRAADYDDILENSRIALSNQIDPKKLYDQVAYRQQHGTLEILWGESEAKELVRLTQRLAARHGLEIPPDTIVGADFLGFMRQANAMQDQLDLVAQKDPAKMMDAAVKEGDRLARVAKGDFKEQVAADPLRDFAKPRLMAATAAEELLKPGNVEKLELAASRWGNGPAMQKLRFYAIQKMFAPLLRDLESMSKLDPKATLEQFETMSAKQRELLFPNGLDKDIETIVQNMRLIYGRGLEAMPGFSAGAVLNRPFQGGIKASILTEAEAWLVTHPLLVRSIAALFRSGPEYKKVAEHTLTDNLLKWSTVNYLATTLMPDDTTKPPAPIEPWQDRLRKSMQPKEQRDWQKRLSAPAPAAP